MNMIGTSSQEAKVRLGTAGEYLVAYQLCRMGYLPNLSPRGYRGFDIHAYNPINGKSIDIQVKTTDKKTGFPLGKGLKPIRKLEHSETIFVFVQLNHEVEFYIAPAREVAKIVLDRFSAKYRHLDPEKQLWTMGKDDLAPYRDKWSSLGLG